MPFYPLLLAKNDHKFCISTILFYHNVEEAFWGLILYFYRNPILSTIVDNYLRMIPLMLRFFCVWKEFFAYLHIWDILPPYYDDQLQLSNGDHMYYIPTILFWRY